MTSIPVCDSTKKTPPALRVVLIVGGDSGGRRPPLFSRTAASTADFIPWINGSGEPSSVHTSVHRVALLSAQMEALNQAGLHSRWREHTTGAAVLVRQCVLLLSLQRSDSTTTTPPVLRVGLSVGGDSGGRCTPLFSGTG
jgi:hypothetical protein